MGADKILLEVAIEHKGEVLRVPIPRSAAATFDSVAGIKGVQVEDLYSAMLVSSADAFFSALATRTKPLGGGKLNTRFDAV